MDTPEVFGGAECFGPEASAYTKRVLRPGRRVRYRLGREPRDRYGRALAYVWLPGGRLFNGMLAEQGYALPLTIPPNDDFARRFLRAARRARRAARGLWSERACRAEAGRDTGSPSRRRRPGGGRNCADFSSPAAAQRYFDRRGGRRGQDRDGLDGDGDGRVCE